MGIKSALIFITLLGVAYASEFRLSNVFIYDDSETNLMGTFIPTIRQFDVNTTSDIFFTPSNAYLDPTDKQTVLMVAEMTSNAYLPLNDTELIPRWNITDDFGWDSNATRGYVYMSQETYEIVIVFKGTSLTGDTSSNDKLMDNTMFSCCCAFESKPVCGCNQGKNICSQTCIENHVRTTPSYYLLGLEIYHKVSKLYPNSIIHFAGHSLGGGVASVLATDTYGMAITFGSPGAKIYSERLGLDGYTPKVYNYGSNLDPIYQGVCNGASSSCYYVGYVIETSCQLGLKCEYIESGSMNVNHHRISNIMSALDKGGIPKCLHLNCTDCGDWKFV